MRTNVEIDQVLSDRLNVLLNQPRRDLKKAALGRAAYLDQAQELANSSSPAVTTAEKRRHIGWMHPLQQFFRFQNKKEHSPMLSALGTILLIVSLALGGGGVTVAAAQNSLPDEVLYPVKTWSEDVRTGLTTNAQNRLALELAYANRRAEEMQVMLRAGEIPPEAVQARMQAELDTALQLTAGQPDNAAVQSLEQIRQQIQVHEQAFTNLGPGAGTQAEAVLKRTHAMLQERLYLCDQGIQDPDLLRQQLRDRDRLHEGTGPGSDPASGRTGTPRATTPAGLARTPTPGSGYGPGPGDDRGENNHWAEHTPTHGSGDDHEPGDGIGENRHLAEGTPTPGSGYGPGPGDGSGTGDHDGSGEPCGDCGGSAEPGGAGEPGGNENHDRNGTGSHEGGEAGDGSGPDNGSTEDGSAGGGHSGTGGNDSGAGGGSGSGGSGTGGSGGKH